MDVAGSVDGAHWEVRDGLLNLDVRTVDTLALLEDIRFYIKVMTADAENYAAKEGARLAIASDEPSDAMNSILNRYDAIHRASRMCWELLKSKRISSLDAKDCELLYSCQRSSGTSWITRLINGLRVTPGAPPLISMPHTDPKTADDYAKSVSRVMES